VFRAHSTTTSTLVLVMAVAISPALERGRMLARAGRGE
jgi:hypothetical protein